MSISDPEDEADYVGLRQPLAPARPRARTPDAAACTTARGGEHGQTSAQKKNRIGYDYVHSAIDDHSRLAYSEILPDEKGPTYAGFLARAAAEFAAAGISAIRPVMTDDLEGSRKPPRAVVRVWLSVRVGHAPDAI